MAEHQYTSTDETTQGLLADLQARHLLLATQAAFFFCVAVCLLINHGEMAENDGISFYGVFHETIPILIVGYGVGAVGLWRTSSYLRIAGAPFVTWLGMRVVGLSLVGLLLTPYSHGTFFNWSHMTVGVVGALVQLAIAIQLVRRALSTRTVLGLAAQLGGGIVCAASLPDWNFSWLLLGEIIFQLGFAWCLLEWTRALGEATGR
jgi:hypothetical protein